MTTGIIITGALGRMGIEIASAVLLDKTCEIVGCFERADHPQIGSTYGSAIGKPELTLTVVKDIAEISAPGVVIDFTSPESTIGRLPKLTSGNYRGLVVGTTGITADGVAALKEASKKLAIVYSPNMSLGVNFLFYLTKLAAEKLSGQFDIEIIEAHHRFKKDSPSGTARKLGEIAAEAMNAAYDEVVVDGRGGMVGERPRREIGMHAVRGGDIVGDHTVLFAGLGERIELRHVAHNRATFAQGAVAAAKWVSGKAPGLYTMQDVLGI